MDKIKQKIVVFSLMLLVIILTMAVPPVQAASPEQIVVIHTNDSHGRVIADDKMVIGISKLKTFINRIQAQNPRTVVLDAGDTFYGLPIISQNQGDNMIGIMNMLGYDAMVPGNHDFNYGIRRLQSISRSLNFPIVAANLWSDQGERLFPPYMIKDVGGYRVGVLGLVTPDTAFLTHPDNVKGLVFTDPYLEAATVVKELRESRNVDVVIALTHLGLNPSSAYTSRNLAEEVEGIDLIVDGHSHTVLPVGQNTKGALIVSAGSYTNYYGKVVLTMQRNKVAMSKANLYSSLDLKNVPGDSQIDAALKKSQQDLNALGKEIIAKTQIALDGETAKVRTGQTNLGHLLAEAVRQEGNADIAVINGGTIRSSIGIGDISKLDVITVLPFGNIVVTRRVTGKEIIEVLENGVSLYPNQSGRFPQVAGLTFVADYSKPAQERIIDVQINGEPLQDDKTYTLACSDFMAAGGDGYIMLKNTDLVGEYRTLDEAFTSFLKSTPIIK